MRLLHAGAFQLFQNYGYKVLRTILHRPFPRIDNIVVFIHGQHTVRGKALHGKWSGHAHFLVVRIGLVVQKFKVRLGGDGGVNFLLSGDAGLPPGGVNFDAWPAARTHPLRGGFPILPTPCPERR